MEILVKRMKEYLEDFRGTKCGENASNLKVNESKNENKNKTLKKEESELERYLNETMTKRVMILDGAMGTTIQKYKFSEQDFRGNGKPEFERFSKHEHPLQGDNDLLVITQAEVIKKIHKDYLKAGADILETNTFNATTISQADYKLSHLAYELNVAAAKVAKQACIEFEKENPNSNKKFVAGAIGPTNKTLSISPSVEDPGFRDISFVFCVCVFVVFEKKKKTTKKKHKVGKM